MSKADPAKFAMVGVILQNKYNISPSEKKGFFALVTDQPANTFTGDNSPAPSPVPQLNNTPQPQVQQSPLPNASNVKISGKASRGDNGTTPTVQFDNGSKFATDVVAWRKGHIEIIRDGNKFADLGYTGGGYGEGKGKRGLKMGLNEIGAAVSNNRKENVISMGWEITTIKGTRNTSVDTAASMNGIHQVDPNGLEGEAVAATEIYKQQVDPSFTYPGYDKLQQAAGVKPYAK